MEPFPFPAEDMSEAHEMICLVHETLAGAHREDILRVLRDEALMKWLAGELRRGDNDRTLVVSELKRRASVLH
ncbi:MAG: hypothetical protein AB7G35_10555 [Hyphomicrobiaceae bacterium]